MTAASRPPLILAVDGPSGVGKTSVSRGVAAKLGWDHLDTGAYYRAATIAVLVRRIEVADHDRVASAVIDARMRYVDGRMFLEGIDMSEAIRTDTVNRYVSLVAANPRVRRALVEQQRAWALDRDGAVVEGRDIGTAVFPSAPLKIYLTARAEIRAARRAGETDPAAIERIAAELARRDAIDSTRDVSPLEAAADAVIVDTSDLSQDEVIAEIVRLAADRGLT